MRVSLDTDLLSPHDAPVLNDGWNRTDVSRDSVLPSPVHERTARDPDSRARAVDSERNFRSPSRPLINPDERMPPAAEGLARLAPAAAHEGYTWYRLRSSQYDEIYLSPHLDDAVYSAGGQLRLQRAAGKRILVITAFANGMGPSTNNRGDRFRDYARRKGEELTAMEELDLDFLLLDLPDGLHREHDAREVVRICLPFLALVPGEHHARLSSALQTLLPRLIAPGGKLYFPLAVGAHPDHRIVFDVGRELHATGQFDVNFYEDVAYVHIEGMLAERLRSLGMRVSMSFFRFARGVHRFFFRYEPRWKGIVYAPQLYLFLFVRYMLQRITRIVDRRPGERDATAVERDISSAIDIKVRAIRAYGSQTESFFARGDAIYQELLRSGDRYIERYWKLPPSRDVQPFPSFPEFATACADELRRAHALLTELRHGPIESLAGLRLDEPEATS